MPGLPGNGVHSGREAPVDAGRRTPADVLLDERRGLEALLRFHHVVQQRERTRRGRRCAGSPTVPRRGAPYAGPRRPTRSPTRHARVAGDCRDRSRPTELEPDFVPPLRVTTRSPRGRVQPCPCGGDRPLPYSCQGGPLTSQPELGTLYAGEPRACRSLRGLAPVESRPHGQGRSRSAPSTPGARRRLQPRSSGAAPSGASAGVRLWIQPVAAPP